MEKAGTVRTASKRSLTVASVNPTQKLALTIEEQLAFHRRLQVCLDIGQLIAGFAKTLSEFFTISNLDYRQPALDITVTYQTPAQHKSHYFLNLEKCDLGELTITRNKRFSEEELALLEQAIGILPCYLNNALEHYRLKKTAFTDSLTGVMNRAALEDLLPREIERAERHSNELSLLMIDLDHFKDCNDLVGHLGGDQVLREVTETIQHNVRFSDLVFRYGGEEFLVVLPHADHDGALQVSELIRKAVSKLTINIGQQIVTPTVSIGVATHNKNDDKSMVVMRADKALYQAKLSGRNCTYSEQQITAHP